MRIDKENVLIKNELIYLTWQIGLPCAFVAYDFNIFHFIASKKRSITTFQNVSELEYRFIYYFECTEIKIKYSIDSIMFRSFVHFASIL